MHKFSPQKAGNLETDERYSLLQPERTLREFGLREGMTVLDVGTGTGFFARSAAKIVGQNGTVYAADISSDMLASFRCFGVPGNVHLLESGEYEIPLPSGISDLTLFAFVLHESEDVQRTLAEAARISKPGGRIVIIEWKKQAEEKGPPMEERMSLDELRTHRNGFNIVLSGELNPSHYYCILEIKEGKN